MDSWVYFLHAPRENFAATITDDEAAVMGRHRDHLENLLADGVLVMAGPTLGPVNTGIAVIEAADEESARAIMASDPAITAGLMTGELRPMRVTFLRGRD